MKLKFYLRGLGIGILVTWVIMSVVNHNKVEAVKEQVRAAYERSPSKEVFVLDRLCERGTLTLCVNLSAFDADFARSGCAAVLFNGKKVFETTIKG